MKLPPRPPSLKQLKSEDVLKVFAERSEELTRFVQRANFRYLHWDTIRHTPAPKGFSPDQAWLAIKASRLTPSKQLPMLDKEGEPFMYWLPESALQALHQVDQHAAGNFLASEDQDPTLFKEVKDQLLINSLMDEAIATSQLEGAVTTRTQAKDLLRSSRKATNKSEQMIVNSYRTIQHLRSLAKQKIPLSIELLNDIHREITVETLDDPEAAGKLRTTNHIQIRDEIDGEILFIPPKAASLPDRLQRLFNFANAPSKDISFVHPLVKASILHFWLAYEHPYEDGNGRTARALFYWYMLKEGYWLFEYLTISQIVYLAPRQYYRSFLYSEHDDNDLTYSLVYMLKVTQRAIQKLHRHLKEKQQENQRFTKILFAYPGLNYRQRTLLNNALKNRNKVYTIAAHRTSNNISYQTARTDLLELAERGFLVQLSAGKQFVFVPAEDLASRIQLAGVPDKKTNSSSSF